jgi:DHA1 family bicyclomycin/chloramphenicol resistance-like MFS transporter
METGNRTLIIFILGLLSAIGPFSIDMYLPGFPSIAGNLHTTVDKVGYSLSSFFTGVCMGQLMCGPLLDRFGRKKPLIAGLLLYIIASFGCSFSPSVEMLVAFRFLQALGACVAMVAPGAIVRDIFPVKENAKIFSMLILILGVSPILAPTAGSFLVASYGWQIVFIVLAVVAATILAVVIRWLPESRKPDPSLSLRPDAIIKAYTAVFKQPQFITYAFAGAVAAAGLFAYIAGSPYVFMTMYGISEKGYGLIFSIIAVGLIGSSQLNNRLLRKYNSAQILRVVLFTQTITGLLLIAGVLTSILGLYSTIALIFVFLSCQGFTFPNSAALAMAPFTQGAGSASAMMGALQMIFGSLASAFVGLFFNSTAVPMAAIMALCCSGGLIILLAGHRRDKRDKYAAKQKDVEEQTFDMIEKY